MNNLVSQRTPSRDLVSNPIVTSECAESKKYQSSSHTDDDSILSRETYFLCILLSMGLIATGDSSVYMVWTNKLICLSLLVGALGTLIYVPKTYFATNDTEASGVVLVGRLIYCIYTTTMYIYISSLARSSPGIISAIRELSRREGNNNNNIYTNPCRTEHPIKAIVLGIMFFCLANVVISVLSPEIASSVLGLSDNFAFVILLNLLVYFLTFGWLLPIPFVYLGCKLLTEKIKYLIAYVHTEFRTKKFDDNNIDNNGVDIEFVMEWHDELYDKNRALNEILSGMVTVTIGFLAVASIVIAINIAIVGFNSNDTFWFFTNFFILVCTCYPVAELEVQNKLLGIELGALPMPRTLQADLNLYLNLYQTCAIKTSRSEFGIFIKGTKIRITFIALIRIGSITLSVIIFLGGILHVDA